MNSSPHLKLFNCSFLIGEQWIGFHDPDENRTFVWLNTNPLPTDDENWKTGRSWLLVTRRDTLLVYGWGFMEYFGRTKQELLALISVIDTAVFLVFNFH